ncbi:MAG: hypothetical protein JJ863_38980 [Deltaproteobacteria bacterium]|nr:hypothetical protein [Deltaproteobacteria bacterium]
MSQIRRMIDDPETPEGVREGLEKAAAETEPYDVEAGLGRLQAVLAAGGVAAAGGTAAAATSATTGKVWLSLALVGALAGGGAIAFVASQDERPVDSERPSTDSRAEEPSESEPSVSEPSVPPATLPEAEDEAPPEREAPLEQPPAAEPAPERTADPQPRVTSPALALRQETLQLARVRAALEHTPAEALRLARQGQREFPDGVFAEEREALIVMALERSGQHARARRAALAFIERYPNGPSTERVREISEAR